MDLTNIDLLKPLIGIDFKNFFDFTIQNELLNEYLYLFFGKIDEKLQSLVTI